MNMKDFLSTEVILESLLYALTQAAMSDIHVVCDDREVNLATLFREIIFLAEERGVDMVALTELYWYDDDLYIEAKECYVKQLNKQAEAK